MKYIPYKIDHSEPATHTTSISASPIVLDIPLPPSHKPRPPPKRPNLHFKRQRLSGRRAVRETSSKMPVSTVDESVDLKIPASACGGNQWRIYAQKSMVARKGWLSAKEEIHGTTTGPEPGSTYSRRMELH